MRWTGKLTARLKEERRVSLKKEREKSHKMILNVLITVNKDIIQRTATLSLNRIKE
jgi:hypothetical protein